MENERIYHFNLNRGFVTHDEWVKESDLTEQHKQLLLGDALNSYNLLPESVKEKFLSNILKCSCGRYLGLGRCNICDNDE